MKDFLSRLVRKTYAMPAMDLLMKHNAHNEVLRLDLTFEFVRIPRSHHPDTRLHLEPGFRDPGSVLIVGQVTQYGNPYLICAALSNRVAVPT